MRARRTESATAASRRGTDRLSRFVTFKPQHIKQGVIVIHLFIINGVVEPEPPFMARAGKKGAPPAPARTNFNTVFKENNFFLTIRVIN